MTTLREAAQQALKALEQCGLDDTHRSYEFEHAARAALCAALAQPDTCEWVQGGYKESDTWLVSCSGRYFMLEDGTPKDNRMTHCCYCGKTLVEVPFEQEEGDD